MRLVITLVPKVDKAKKRNEKENYRSLLLMNIDITVFKKILLNQIQKHTKRIIQEDGEMAQQ